MNMYATLLKTISPASGLGLLKIGIEKRLGVPIKSYSLVYFREQEQIVFVVPMQGTTITENYVGANKDKIIFIVKNLCQQQLKEGETIDIVKINYTPEGVDVEMAITKDGIKTKINHKLS